METGSIHLRPEDSAEITGGLLIPYITARFTIKAIEPCEKIIERLTTEH